MTAPAPATSSPVGLIAAGGAMPFAVADSLSQRGVTPVLFAIRGACDERQAARFRHHWIANGQLGRAMKLFRDEGCRDLMFIGSLVRPALSEVRLDWGTLRLLGQVWSSFRGGDDHLLSGIGRILEGQGFRMVDFVRFDGKRYDSAILSKPPVATRTLANWSHRLSVRAPIARAA